MKILFVSVLLFLFSFSLDAEIIQKLTFLGRWDDNSLDSFSDQAYSSLWGYTSPNGTEYAIMGGINDIFFLEIPKSGTPILRDKEKGRASNCIHREFQVKDDYAYAVSDENRGSLQIFDLKYLPDSVHKVYDSDTFFNRCHDITIEGNRLYCAMNNGNIDYHPFTILDISNPEKPSLGLQFNPKNINGTPIIDLVHESTFRNDTGYLSCGGQGLFIVDFKDLKNPKILTAIQKYPQQGYNHSSILSNDGNILYFTDEDIGLQQKCYDLKNLKKTGKSPNYVKTFGIEDSKGVSVAHNQFIKGNVLYVSYYKEGVACFDITDPKNPQFIDRYDTYVGNINQGAFSGCWQVFPYFKSNRIIASDESNGLFVLKLDSVTGIENQSFRQKKYNPYFIGQNQIVIEGLLEPNIIEIYDIQGNRISFSKDFKTNRIELKLSDYKPQIIIVKIIEGNNTSIFKMIKT